MSGKRYFLDTNAIVQLLAGNSDLIKTLSGASYVATSVICVLEFTCFSGLTEGGRCRNLLSVPGVEEAD